MPRPDRSWIARLTADEQQALQDSEAFFLRPEGRVHQAVAKFSRPFNSLVSLTPASFQETLARALHSILTTLAFSSEDESYERRLIDEICLESGQELEPWARIFEVDLKIIETLARKKTTGACRLAMVQGGATGLGGILGLLADLPTLYYLVFRTTKEIALCFGHPVKSSADWCYHLEVINVGHHLESRERRLALIELETPESTDLLNSNVPTRSHLEQASNEDLQRTLLAKSLQGLARSLTRRLVVNKVAQSVALVGGAVGAALNRQIVQDVSNSAFHAYRRRFLFQVAKQRLTHS